nr:unnamed protein product [Spirometra erinaceieuropaei]
MSDAEDPCHSELTYGTELKPILEGAAAAKIIAVKKAGQASWTFGMHRQSYESSDEQSYRPSPTSQQDQINRQSSVERRYLRLLISHAFLTCRNRL